jgi:hypothetical protein
MTIVTKPVNLKLCLEKNLRWGMRRGKLGSIGLEQAA